MFSLSQSHKFFLCTKPTDMRKSFDALSLIVRTGMNRNPLSGEVFIFINRRHNLMKLLNWQKGGFVLYYKRLEQGTFEIPFADSSGSQIKISHTELAMIITGISLKNMRKRKRFSG